MSSGFAQGFVRVSQSSGRRLAWATTHERTPNVDRSFRTAPLGPPLVSGVVVLTRPHAAL
jgi:hypothetical protein